MTLKALRRRCEVLLRQASMEEDLAVRARLLLDTATLLDEASLRAMSGPVWPRRKDWARASARAEATAPSLDPVTKMVSKGRPNRRRAGLAIDAEVEWRYSTTYRRCAEELEVGTPDADGRHVWLTEREQRAVASRAKAKNAGL